MLDSKQLAEAQLIIDSAAPGIYELKQLYGKRWLSIQAPTIFGSYFKESVVTGKLSNIYLLTPKTNNHQTYEVCPALRC